MKHPAVQRIDRADWAPIGEIARITGIPVRTLAHRIKVWWAPRGLAERRRPFDGGKARWYVQRRVDPRLALCPAREMRDGQSEPVLAEKYPAHLCERAWKRNRWLQAWRRAVAAPRDAKITDRALAGRIVDEARRVEGEGFRISVRSLYLWWQRYNRQGQNGKILGVEGLVDRYGDCPERPTRSNEAVELFYTVFHAPAKLSVATCHDVIIREAERQGWAWPKTYSATMAWLQEHDDRSLTCLMREGSAVWARRYLPHRLIDYTKIEPGSMYVADHHQVDLWVRYKSTQIRPWLTAIQDCRSRCIVGWHLGPAPHQDAILSAMLMAFRDWAIPEVMRIDNGRDFTCKPITGYTKAERKSCERLLGSEWGNAVWRDADRFQRDDPRWDGIAAELGIELIFAIPYSPWSKGTLERWFETFEGQCGKTFATYCGNETRNRPECVDEIREHPEFVPTLDEARTIVGEYLDRYHRHSRRGLNGRSPFSVWQQSTRLRKAAVDELAFLVSTRGLYKVAANGISLKIGTGTFHYGAGEPRLRRFVGRKVLIALDPTDVSQCWAFTPDGDNRKLIARLANDEGVAPYSTADDAREAIAEAKREQSIMQKAQRAYGRRTMRMSQRMREHARAGGNALRATGTDDAKAAPVIVPVRTGFEAPSNTSRTGFNTPPVEPSDVWQRLHDFAMRPEPPKDPTPSGWSRLLAVGREEAEMAKRHIRDGTAFGFGPKPPFPADLPDDDDVSDLLGPDKPDGAGISPATAGDCDDLLIDCDADDAGKGLAVTP